MELALRTASTPESALSSEIQASDQPPRQVRCDAGETYLKPVRESSEQTACELVDARGHRCPMPLLMAKRALNGVASGERVRVLSTDEGSVRDFEVFARQSGHRLLNVGQENGEFDLLLEKS